MQSGQTGQWTKAETGKTLSFYVPASAPVIVPAEKQRVKAGGQRRPKLGFTAFTSAGKGIGRENAFLGAPLCAQSCFRPPGGASRLRWSLGRGPAARLPAAAPKPCASSGARKAGPQQAQPPAFYLLEIEMSENSVSHPQRMLTGQ